MIVSSKKEMAEVMALLTEFMESGNKFFIKVNQTTDRDEVEVFNNLSIGWDKFSRAVLTGLKCLNVSIPFPPPGCMLMSFITIQQQLDTMSNLMLGYSNKQVKEVYDKAEKDHDFLTCAICEAILLERKGKKK